MYQDLAYYRTMQLAGLIKEAGADIKPNSTMIALYPPKKFATKIKPHASDDQKDSLHVTVIYLGETTDEEAELAGTILEKVTARHAPVALSVNGAGVFYNPEGAVRQLLVNGPGLNEFRAALFNALDDAGLMPEQKYGYIPHMTLEYHKDGQMPERWELVGKGKYPAWDASEVCLVRGDKTQKTCELLQEKKARIRTDSRAYDVLSNLAGLTLEPSARLQSDMGTRAAMAVTAPLRIPLHAANAVTEMPVGGPLGLNMLLGHDALATAGLGAAGYGGYRGLKELQGNE